MRRPPDAVMGYKSHRHLHGSFDVDIELKRLEKQERDHAGKRIIYKASSPRGPLMVANTKPRSHKKVPKHKIRLAPNPFERVTND